jgi:hypothetical protein
MDVQEFEQAILKLAFETDARITTASVAYYLGIPSKKANELLNALLEEGVLELDSDQDGNLYYRVPNQPDGNDGLLPRLRLEQQSEVDASAKGPQHAARPESAQAQQQSRPKRLPPSVALVSASEQDDTEPVSPRQYGRRQLPDDSGAGDYARLAGRREGFERPGDHDGQAGGRADVNGWKPSGGRSKPIRVERSHPEQGGGRRGGPDGWNEPRKPRVQTRTRNSGELFSGLTHRQARPDASLDRCGASPVIVSDSVRCDPKPLPSRKPVVASCVEPSARKHNWTSGAFESSNGQLFERAQSQSTMLAPTAGGELAMRDDGLERPEHQPGMALLLSLILCGTGQIYNGEVSKGIMMMVLCFLLWFVLLGWVVHIWSIVDSVVVAERLNRKAG